MEQSREWDSGMESALDWQERCCHVWLGRVEMSAVQRAKLKGDARAIRRAYEADPRGISLDVVRRDLKRWALQGIHLLVPSDQLYQELFGRYGALGIHTPYQIYMKGKRELLEKPGIAFVGSREVGPYGRRLTRDLVGAMAGLDATVISGGALGVDTLAHERALEVGLATICVLGCGIGYDYPPGNGGLFRELEANHLVISEYEPFSPPRRYYFPERNRIIAQLARAVVVTAAAEGSGSLITAEHAMECAVPVLTAPWDVYHRQGVGCHFLLATGAQIITGAAHFREMLLGLGL